MTVKVADEKTAIKETEMIQSNSNEKLNSNDKDKEQSENATKEQSNSDALQNNDGQMKTAGDEDESQEEK